MTLFLYIWKGVDYDQSSCLAIAPNSITARAILAAKWRKKYDWRGADDFESFLEFNKPLKTELRQLAVLDL